MKTKILLLSCFFLTSCSFQQEIEPKSEIKNMIVDVEHDYYEVEDKMISWNQIFDQKEDSYFVYFYSLTCNHCQSIKNEVIGYALNNNDIFFVKSSNLVVLKNDVSYTIGAGNVGDFAIIGYPSMIEISNGIVIKNVAGTSKILNLLSYHFFIE